MSSPVTAEDWRPGLENGDRPLGEIYRARPEDAASAVPWYVRLLENPRSPRVRALLGIQREVLYAAYAVEQARWPQHRPW